MNKVLILLAHPRFEKSKTNRALLKDIERQDGITFNDLYEQYPDFNVDVAREKDLLLQYTTTGIHKDDLILNLNGTHIKLTGSQGQQKTYLVSLKLAQFEFLKEVNKILPLLLLDDIFDKFDASRVRQILKLVGDKSFGQIFITHTNLERMNIILKELDIDHKLFLVEDRKVEEREEIAI